MLSSQDSNFSGKIKIKGLSISSNFQLSPKNYSITCQLSKKNLASLPNRFIPKHIKFGPNNVILSQFVIQCSKNQSIVERNKQYLINIVAKGNQQDQYHKIFNKQYRCLYIDSTHLYPKSSRQIKLYVKSDKEIKLFFYQVERPRFAKTAKLQQIMLNLAQDEGKEDSGIISMDQSGRFLVEQSSCSFPAIGMWLKCQDISSIQVYLKCCSFLKRKTSKKAVKFLVQYEKSDYIIFVRLWGNQLPELYLLSWKEILNEQGQPNQICVEYDIKSNKQVTLKFNKPNLQFTLRGNNSQSHSNINNLQQKSPFDSPKKQITNQQLQYQLQRLHLQQSPQFSSVKKMNSSNFKYSSDFEEKTVMKQKIIKQQLQITTLKQQVKKLSKELEIQRSKKSICNCMSRSPPQKLLANFKSPTLIFSSSQAASSRKKLSSSDLEQSSLDANINMKIFQSGSTTAKQTNSLETVCLSKTNSQNNSYQKQYSKQITRHMVPNRTQIKCPEGIRYQQEPWDMMQLIQ